MMWVPVKKLQKYCDPLAKPPWPEQITPISKAEIEARIALGKLYQHRAYSGFCLEDRESHIERIAWLTLNGWGDSHICLDFTHGWCLYDGNHRMSAAICRGDEMIWADVAGPWGCIHELYRT